MISYYHLIRFWILMAVLGSAVSAEEKPPLCYPCTVTMGEQEAVMKNPGDLFAIIDKPGKADDVLKVAKKAEVLIANVCPCKVDGTILDGNNVIPIFAQNSDTLKLEATLKEEALKPGTYLINVGAHGTTSRVVFTIADPKGKLKSPKISDILKYLKGDS
ncbi:MAG: hypothetical protein ACJAQT_000219 [Akkermansiaceae bacterium]|jgi:hypothetical protein